METAHTIAALLDQGRKFNLIYIRMLDPSRLHERYTFNGVEMNSAQWIIGHLAWAEVSMVLGLCGGQIPKLPWLEQFAAGQAAPDQL